MKSKTVQIIISIFILFDSHLYSQPSDQIKPKAGKRLPSTLIQDEPSDSTLLPLQDGLVVLWTSGDRDVALKMAYMYTYNARRWEWWDDIILIVWGPSAKLLSEDEELQAEVKKMMDIGVVIKACKGCSDQYGVSEKLIELGVDVKYIGKEFTDYIKGDWHILTI